MVRLVLAADADIEARDTTFYSTPLSWASVGSGRRPRYYPGGDWVATVQAKPRRRIRHRRCLDCGQAVSDEVVTLLLAYGIGLSDDATDELATE